MGNIPLGGEHPIRIQTMTVADTMDTTTCVEEIVALEKAGSEYVRLTVPTLRDARNLEIIRKELKKRGCRVPLIADIHFTPNAAEYAARIVEKVRVNPGNYADKKKFQVFEYTDRQYNDELDRVSSRFLPLVKVCKDYGTAMRIGSNHGSLSDRIMNRFGDTPLGMVESALEFVRICESMNFRDLVLSMKASNPIVMIQSYRLLCKKLQQEGLPAYPLHLGVTEAGDGMEGRIKSSLGIGVLLEEGLGDTIRVSLTEESVKEVAFCKTFLKKYHFSDLGPSVSLTQPDPLDLFNYSRRATRDVGGVGEKNLPVVVGSLMPQAGEESLRFLGYARDRRSQEWSSTDVSCDFIYCGARLPGFRMPPQTRIIADLDLWSTLSTPKKGASIYPLLSAGQFSSLGQPPHPVLNFLHLDPQEINSELIDAVASCRELVLLLQSPAPNALKTLRAGFTQLMNAKLDLPVLVRMDYDLPAGEEFLARVSTDVGGLFVDGLGDGIMINCRSSSNASWQGVGFCSDYARRVAFGILQASRVRSTSTEFISCPSCGRTQFDLQETTRRIRTETRHLKGLKIGIMGCIVNGPGEMADADYGYVGSGKGKITLYRKREVVKRNVSSEEATVELVNLIKEDGNWRDPGQNSEGLQHPQPSP